MQQQDEHQQPHSPDNALYDRYAASIFAYARLHTISWEDAEDFTPLFLKTAPGSPFPFQHTLERICGSL